MNDRQREILRYLLTNEKETLNKLQAVYEQASRDCARKIADLSAREDLENIESIIYQKKYQQTIKNQIDEVLNTLRSGSFDVVNNHVNDCYENGFIGAMYDLHGQKIPIISPIDLNLVVKAIKNDTKLSGGLYKRMGEDIQKLKKDVTVQVSAGIAGGSTWNEMADKIAVGMNSPFKKAKNIAMRIAVTEGHRVQNQGALDAGIKAKSKGADIVKQWDATLDGRTRPSHARVDGEIVELEDSFSNGLSMPGDPKGHPKEVVRCRCALLQRAKWGLDYKELKTLEDRAKYFGLDKADNFEDFKSRYLGYNSQITNYAKAIDSLTLDKSYGYNRYTREEILGNMQTSKVGKDAIRYILESNVRIYITDVPNIKPLRGEQTGDEIIIYSQNIASLRIAGQSVIHEITHHKYKIGGCQHAEAICFAFEKMHKENRDFLYPDEWDNMISLAKQAYPELEWERGGYGDFKQFNFVKYENKKK